MVHNIVSWTSLIFVGTNLTANFRCSCKDKLSWSTQSYIEGTKTRTGNLAIVAAACVAPVSYPDLASLCYAAKIPFMSSNRSFNRLARYYVYPSIENAYYAQRADLMMRVPDPVS